MILNIKHCIGFCFLAFVPVCVSAQSSDKEEEDDKRPITEVPLGIFRNLLQQRTWTKHYENKAFGDHLFFEGGAGINMMGVSGPELGAHTEGAVGDWVTPEHGWRVAMNGGTYNTAGKKAKYLGWSFDYLLNFMAVSSSHYDNPRPFEVYGIAGWDVAFSVNGLSKREKGWGAHVGLRGQYNLPGVDKESGYTYLYVEPRLGLLSDNIPQVGCWHNKRPVGTLFVGAGYRLGGTRAEDGKSDDSKSWTDGLFLSAMGGPSFFANSTPKTYKDYFGGRGAISLGKWFSPIHAVRLTGNYTSLKDGKYNKDKVKTIGGQLEYMANLHNVFGGVSDSRWWWVNGLVGGSMNSHEIDGERTRSYGLSAALQGNFKISSGYSLFIEPRFDFYTEDYVPAMNTRGKWDIVPSVLAGITYTKNPSTRISAENEEDEFNPKYWHDYMFVETALGLNVPLADGSNSKLRGLGYVGVGKWFTPLSGARLWGQIAETKNKDEKGLVYRHMEIGVDYLFSISNLFSGYSSERKFELDAAAGVNMASKEDHTGLHFGAEVAVRGIYHVNPFLGIYLEPKLQGYSHNFLPSSRGTSKIDLIGSTSLGVQFDLRNYDRVKSLAAVEEDGGYRSSISVAGGFAIPASDLTNSSFLGQVYRINYTHWFTPLSAWRINLQGYGNRYAAGHRYAWGTLGADYMSDLTAHTYGYNPERVLSIHAFTGFNLGVDYSSAQTDFVPDLHFGGQMDFRLTDRVHLYLESQVAYRINLRWGMERMRRWLPQLMAGVSYNMKRDHGATSAARPKLHQFASVGVGTGAFTGNVGYTHPLGRKFTFVSDVAYGQWLTGLHGWQVGVSNTMIRHTESKVKGVKGEANEYLTSVKVSYVMNLRTALTGESTEGKLFQLTGIAGISATFINGKDRENKVAPGLQGALQAGFRVTPSLEVFIQPEGALFPHSVGPFASPHPMEGDARLLFGTKFCF